MFTIYKAPFVTRRGSPQGRLTNMLQPHVSNARIRQIQIDRHPKLWTIHPILRHLYGRPVDREPQHSSSGSVPRALGKHVYKMSDFQ